MKVGKKYDIEQMKFDKLGTLLLKDKGEKYYLAASNIKTTFPQIKDEFIVPKWVEKVISGFLRL